MTPGRASRAARAAIFAAVCVTTTALGHALMSGDAVPWWSLAAAFAATCTATWWLTGRQRGALTVIASTVAAQLALHSLFDLTQALSGNLPAQISPPRASAMSGRADMPGMGSMSDARSVASGMSQTPMAHLGHAPLGMFLAHLLAALVCGLWLWQGESAAFRLARSVVAVLFAPLVLVLATLGLTRYRRPIGPRATALPLAMRATLLQYALSRRGPPALSFCC